ncbi:MAG: tmRNA-binding protein SmpB [Parcubacteria group bacterium Greene0714_21]|nr:MAG: tmRNA-binding protein SmpB [Parcubacteria group bacterium Greene0416_39]TSC97337.1 MAG: tmRNA-binding protein SmpB [Parcubacteria group bacterium Greene1014_47]TSD03936.1 MAG: tmRNA-binding protein SmpB [Parcubacteria group bacterium Greene0714_21]
MKQLAENRKAYFNYEILGKFQAGLVLTGPEVKSVRLGRMQIAGSFCRFQGEELFLSGVTIPPYQPKNTKPNYDPARPRKLLLQKKELNYLFGKVKERGLTLLPLKVYTTNAGKIKIEIALAKGRKKWDKREAIRKREIAREIRQSL